MLPDDRERKPINIPWWLQEYADKWSESGASAVVLFGSRGCGLALPESDWDIAVLFNGDSEIPPNASVSLPSSVTRHHEVCPLRLSITDIRTSFLREISSGVLLNGDLNALIDQGYEGDISAVDREDMMMHLKHGFTSILQGIRAVNMGWKRTLKQESKTCLSLAEIGNSTAENRSAYAAERLAKACCCALVQPFERIHSVSELVKSIPAHWRESVLGLNGTTGKRVQLRYEEPFETSRDTLNRIEHALDLAFHVVEDGYFIPNKSEEEDLQDEIYIQIDPRKEVLDLSDCEPRCEELYLCALAQLDRLKELALSSDPERAVK